MNKLTRILFAAVAAIALTPAVASADRIIWFSGLNPPSSWLLQEERDVRLNEGGIVGALLGGANTAYNITVTANSGLYVTVAPSTTNTQGVLFMSQPDDATAFGVSPVAAGPGVPLAADPTLTTIIGLLSAPGITLGQLPVPNTSGQTIISLIECQIQPLDTTPSSVSVISIQNQKTVATSNRDRRDNVACQYKASPASTNPAQPTVDSGWYSVGAVSVPYGTTSISQANVTQLNQYFGSVPATAAGTLALSALPHGDYIDVSSTPQTKAGKFTAGNLVSTGNLNIANGVLAANPGVPLQLCANNNCAYNATVGNAGDLSTTRNIAAGGSVFAGPGGVTNGGNFAFGNNIASNSYTYVGSNSAVSIAGVPASLLGIGYLTVTSPTGGSSFGGTAEAAFDQNGNMGLAGGVRANGGFSSGNSSVTTNGATIGGNIVTTNGVVVAGPGVSLSLCAANNCGPSRFSIDASGNAVSNGNVTANSGNFITTTGAFVSGTGSPGSSGYSLLGPLGLQSGGNIITASGVYASTTGNILFFPSNSNAQANMDASGNFSVNGAMRATAFNVSSARKLKQDITPMAGDPLEIIGRFPTPSWWRYKTQPTMPLQLGIIADDAPTEVAGPSHDHFDIEATVSITAAALAEEDKHFVQACWLFGIVTAMLMAAVAFLYRERSLLRKV